MRYPLYKSGHHEEALDDPEELRQRELGVCCAFAYRYSASEKQQGLNFFQSIGNRCSIINGLG